MAKIPFIGPSYELRSLSEDCQKTVNLFPVNNEQKAGKSNFFLMGTPGIKKFLIPINSNENDLIRALFVDSKNDLYVVVGYQFIRIRYNNIDKIYEQQIIGNLDTNTGPVSIAENGVEIALVDGDNYYLYNYNDLTFANYKPDGWLGSNTVTYFSSYFVFIERNTQKFYISKQYDGKTLDPLDFASAESSPDNLISSLSIKQNLWLFGTKTIQIYYNSGDELFPIETLDGALINNGCLAPFSIALLDNSPVWLGGDINTSGAIYTTENGNFTPKRISNRAVETAIQSYEKIEDAVAYTYSQDGHDFYLINFPSAKTTWCYDNTTQMWHERQSLNSKTGEMERHRTQLHALWLNKHIVSDFEKNILYILDMDTYLDDDLPIKRIRRSPHFVGENLETIYYNSFQLDLEIGNNYTLNYNSINNNKAQINLRYSNDGGRTWSNYLQQDLGNPGEYKKRIIWRRLGSSRDRVWEVSLTDPIKTVWLNAFSNYTIGNH